MRFSNTLLQMLTGEQFSTEVRACIQRNHYDCIARYKLSPIDCCCRTLMDCHPLAGQYHNRTVFAVDALKRLDNTIDPTHPAKLVLTSVICGGDEEWSVQELHGTGICKNGTIGIPARSDIDADRTGFRSRIRQPLRVDHPLEH
jgi:hypothetical protein